MQRPPNGVTQKRYVGKDRWIIGCSAIQYKVPEKNTIPKKIK
jgi:hypothetical protein